MDILEEYLNIPKSCFVNSRLPKKAFTDNPQFDLKKEEKKILKVYIDSMYLQYSLKPQLINISSYEDEEIRYEEIEIIKVKPKEDRVCNIIQRYIPYPILLVIECNELIKLNACYKED